MSQDRPLVIDPTSGRNTELVDGDTLRQTQNPSVASDVANKAYVDANAVHNLDGGRADTNYGGTTSINGGGA